MKIKFTKIDILNIFSERHRLCSKFDANACDEVEIKLDMTIKEWRNADDLLQWYQLYPYLNKFFKLNISREQWESVLEPANKKNLEGVCELISNNISEYGIDIDDLDNVLDTIIKNNILDTNLNLSSNVSDYLDQYFDIIVLNTILYTKGKRVIHSIDFINKKYTISNMNTFNDLALKIVSTVNDTR